ncbi:MAG: putative lipid II flippase FtsW [Candidatus Sumerlaeia bacterium]|nr:putative lipid II flippase FtsW [Candidatus Sumerlaeia bacterium]
MSNINPRWCIFALVLTLTGVGLVMIYSSSAFIAADRFNQKMSKRLELGTELKPVNTHPEFLQKQLVWFGISLCGLFVFYFLDFNFIMRYAWLFLLLSAAMLPMVYVPGIGMKLNGAFRWIRAGPFTFQPSEMAKLAVVIMTVRLLAVEEKKLARFADFLPLVLLAGGFAGFIAIEDLGTACVIGLIALILWLLAGVPYKHILLLTPGALIAFIGAIIHQPYRWTRIVVFIRELLGLTVSADAVLVHKGSWHIQHSLIAVGTGGLTGVGAGMGVQKHGYLPAIFTDFIMAHICEELGFIGAVVVLALFALLCWQGFRVALQSPDPLSALLASGMTLLIVVPALVNVAVVLNCLPTKGLALPFISYGGSSLLLNYCAMGLLMKIARLNSQRSEEPARVASGEAWLFKQHFA